MSTLEFRGSRRDGEKSLCRRHHDLGGTDYVHIASLPIGTIDALQNGGEILLTLREGAGPHMAPWRLDVLLNGTRYPGVFLTDDRLDALTEKSDRFPVRIEGGEFTLKRREWMRAMEEIKGAEDVLERARQKAHQLEQEVRTMSPRIPVDDGKYEISIEPDGFGMATRYGSPWRALEPRSLPLRIALELGRVRDQIGRAGGDPMRPGETPSRYGPDGDLLRLALEDGTLLVQDAVGRFRAEMDGAEVTELAGDKFTLSLAYELEGARAALAQLQPAPTLEPEESPGL